jgi:hypothetical protein
MSGRAAKTACRLAALSAVTLLAATAPSDAHRRDFPFTVDWMQPTANEKELELHTLYDESGKTWEEEIEFEYGVTSQFAIAPYIVYEKEEGGDFKYAAYKLEARAQLGKFKTNTILPGLYFEMEKPKGEKPELEGKLILSMYDNRGGNATVNFITERQQEAGAQTRYAMSAGYGVPVGRRGQRAGLEILKDIDTGRVNAGPVFAFSPGGNSWLSAGIALPVNNRSDNKTQFRLLTEFEW